MSTQIDEDRHFIRIEVRAWACLAGKAATRAQSHAAALRSDDPSEHVFNAVQLRRAAEDLLIDARNIEKELKRLSADRGGART